LNTGILVISGILAYFLAGKTLKPIEVMVEDQKRFVADASHERRTPLTAMKTEIEVALRGKQLDIKEARLLLDSNLEEVNKIQSLSNYLLSLNCYQDSGQKIPMEKINLKDVVAKATDSVRPLAEKKQITLEVIDNETPMLGNFISLVELVTILLDNAIKYSPRQKNIILTCVQDSKTVSLTVQDFGIGIKAGDIPYIFNRFYRDESSRNKSHEDGYGLGLSIAQNIVNLHKGQISVASTPGTGSVFTVKLPV
jgi:two-component system sensor histidine kinase CiaH